MTTETKPLETTACCPTPEHQDALPAEVAADAAAVFKALSDPTRLRIVRAMADAEHEICECNIVPMFGLSQSTISYHLKVLREAGIVRSEKRGLWAYYRVNPRALMGAVRTVAELV